MITALTSCHPPRRAGSLTTTMVLLATACGGGTPTNADPPGPVPVSSITVTLAAASIPTGQSTTASAVLRDASSAVLNGRSIAWSSSNVAVATVSASGAVTALAVGTTTITATSEGRTGSATLTVTPVTPAVASVTLSMGDADIPIRSSITVVATVRDAGGQPISNKVVTWQTSDASRASVTTSGVIRMLLPGTATITATCEGHSVSIQVHGSVVSLASLADSMRLAKGLPAMGVVAVTREGVAAIGVGGFRRITGGLPVTNDDQWHIGSDLKPITAMLAGVAVDAHVLDWTRTVEAAFPDLLGTMRPEYKPVTLRELLSHQGGMVNTLTGLPGGATNLPALRITWADYTLQQAPNNARGVYYYSNNGYTIAGAMLERAWGGTFEQLMASQLLQPLGVTAWGWGPTTGVGGDDQPVGHSLTGGTWIPCEACDNPPAASPAGTMHMSLASWARIIQELMLADQGRSTLLTQATARQLTTQQVPPGSGVPYAMGWIVTNPTPGSRIITHDGSNTYNHARATVALDTGVAFLITINAGDLDGGSTGAALTAMNNRLNQFWANGR